MMSLLEQEKSTLQEKNNNLNMELASANVEYERLKRESQARQEQDRTNINGLQSELKNFRSQFEQTWYVYCPYLYIFSLSFWTDGPEQTVLTQIRQQNQRDLSKQRRTRSDNRIRQTCANSVDIPAGTQC